MINKELKQTQIAQSAIFTTGSMRASKILPSFILVLSIFFTDFYFNYSKNLAFGYINSGLSSDQIDKQAFEIEVEKKKYSASVVTRPLNNKKLSSL